jgi:hypothetical protein
MFILNGIMRIITWENTMGGKQGCHLRRWHPLNTIPQYPVRRDVRRGIEGKKTLQVFPQRFALPG